MHFGLFSLMAQRDRAVTARQLYEEMVEQVKLAEAIGFDIAWFAEHHFSNYCLCPSPLAMAMALAPQTTRIRLGTAVIVAPLYHPLRMLEEIGMLDVVSGGRAVIGLGTGYQQYEFHRFGVSLENARDTFLETLDVVEHPCPVSPCAMRARRSAFQRHISWCIRCSVGQTSMSRAWRAIRPRGRALPSAAMCRYSRQDGAPLHRWRRRATSSRPRTRRPRATSCRHLRDAALRVVTDDKAEALRAAEAARYIRRVAMSMRNNVARLDGAFLQEIPAADEPPLEEIASRLVVGDADTCAERLATEISALQPVHISCFMGLPAMPQARILRSMERFGSEVMPKLERHFGGLAHIGHPR